MPASLLRLFSLRLSAHLDVHLANWVLIVWKYLTLGDIFGGAPT